MKKYLSFFGLLAIVALALSSNVVLAREGEDYDNGGTRAGASVDAKLGGDDDSDRSFLNRILPSGKGEFKGDWQENRGERREKMETERKDFMDKLKTEREEFRTRVEKEKSDFKLFSSEKRRDFWNKVGEVAGARFTVAITAIEKAQVRIGEIIVKLDTDGKDTTEAEADLALSKSKLADAKAKIAEIKSLLPATGEQITAEIFAQIKLKAREAKDLIKESVEAIRDAIKEIKSLRGNAKVEAKAEADINN